VLPFSPPRRRCWADAALPAVALRLSREQTTAMAGSVWQAWCYTGRKPSLTDVGGDGGGALEASFFPAGGIIAGHQALAARRSRGENPVHLWTCDGGTIGVVPSLEASHREPVSGCGSGGDGWLVEMLVCSGR